jgi:hypothetical protein
MFIGIIFVGATFFQSSIGLKMMMVEKEVEKEG